MARREPGGAGSSSSSGEPPPRSVAEAADALLPEVDAEQLAPAPPEGSLASDLLSHRHLAGSRVEHLIQLCEDVYTGTLMSFKGAHGREHFETSHGDRALLTLDAGSPQRPRRMSLVPRGAESHHGESGVPQWAVVAFGGTRSSEESVGEYAPGECPLAPCDWAVPSAAEHAVDGARVHDGFNRLYSADGGPRQRIVDWMDSIADRAGSVVVVGHSRGGALAVLCAVDLACRRRDLKVELVTFGAPRVGNAAFCELAEKLGVRVARFINRGDLVTALPPESKGIQHFPKEPIVLDAFVSSPARSPADVHQLSAYKENLKKAFVPPWFVSCRSSFAVLPHALPLLLSGLALDAPHPRLAATAHSAEGGGGTAEAAEDHLAARRVANPLLALFQLRAGLASDAPGDGAPRGAKLSEALQQEVRILQSTMRMCVAAALSSAEQALEGQEVVLQAARELQVHLLCVVDNIGGLLTCNHAALLQELMLRIEKMHGQLHGCPAPEIVELLLRAYAVVVRTRALAGRPGLRGHLTELVQTVLARMTGPVEAVLGGAGGADALPSLPEVAGLVRNAMRLLGETGDAPWISPEVVARREARTLLQSLRTELERADIHSASVERAGEILRSLSMSVAVVGTTKSGKSTLVNALVGIELMPVGDGPKSILPIKLRAGGHKEHFHIRAFGEGLEEYLRGKQLELHTVDTVRDVQATLDSCNAAIREDMEGDARAFVRANPRNETWLLEVTVPGMRQPFSILDLPGGTEGSDEETYGVLGPLLKHHVRESTLLLVLARHSDFASALTNKYQVQRMCGGGDLPAKDAMLVATRVTKTHERDTVRALLKGHVDLRPMRVKDTLFVDGLALLVWKLKGQLPDPLPEVRSEELERHKPLIRQIFAVLQGSVPDERHLEEEYEDDRDTLLKKLKRYYGKEGLDTASLEARLASFAEEHLPLLLCRYSTEPIVRDVETEVAKREEAVMLSHLTSKDVKQRSAVIKGLLTDESLERLRANVAETLREASSTLQHEVKDVFKVLMHLCQRKSEGLGVFVDHEHEQGHWDYLPSAVRESWKANVGLLAEFGSRRRAETFLGDVQRWIDEKVRLALLSEATACSLDAVLEAWLDEAGLVVDAPLPASLEGLEEELGGTTSHALPAQPRHADQSPLGIVGWAMLAPVALADSALYSLASKVNSSHSVYAEQSWARGTNQEIITVSAVCELLPKCCKASRKYAAQVGLRLYMTRLIDALEEIVALCDERISGDQAKSEEAARRLRLAERAKQIMQELIP